MQAVERTERGFFVAGTRCAATLYRPVAVPRPPVVVMAHGFGAHRSFGLPFFAERFAENGLAVLLFDHRYLGDSAGAPRGLVNPFRQLDDWRSAIAHVRSFDDVDGERLGLWGTSFSGGHVISIAAEDNGVAAIVAQVPYLDPVTTARRLGVRSVLKLLAAGSWDAVRSLFAPGSFDIPVVGDPGTTACLTTEDSVAGFASIVGDEPWANRCPARSAFAFARYRPMWRARSVRCPAYVVLAEEDSLIAPEVVERAARKMDAELHRVPCGHFHVYGGTIAADLANRQAAFLRNQLGLVSSVDHWRSRSAQGG